MRKVIVNTTPLIALAGIGHLDLLHKLYSEITIPKAVYLEIISEPARSQVSASKWIKVETVSGTVLKSAFSSRLHAGEIEVIMLAQEVDADLLIMQPRRQQNIWGLKLPEPWVSSLELREKA